MTTITGRAESDEAAVAVTSIGMIEDGRLLEESPLAVHLRKVPNVSN